MSARYPLAAAALAACCLALLSPAARAGDDAKLVTRTYPVADLIVPVPHDINLVCNRSEKGTPPPGGWLLYPAEGPAKGSAPQKRQEDQLIRQIMRAVESATWQANGGAGTIDYYPLAMTLIINQRPRVHERIAALLADLRRAQNTEVALEVRFVTVPEDLLERVVQEFGSDGVERMVDCEGRRIATRGLAFLGPRRLAHLIEMVQGDQRSSVVQAPKVTMTNGQVATMSLGDTQLFCDNIDWTCPDKDAADWIQRQLAKTALRLTAQPFVSADRRSVQLELRAEQACFTPVERLIAVPAPGDPDQAAPAPDRNLLSLGRQAARGTFVIPEGQTAVLGGLRRVVEGRNEFGPPVLSKIPYINRLFKNVGYGRESQATLVLATPRVLVNEEEEVRANPTAAEEQEEPAKAASGRQTKVLAELLRAYDGACAEGRAAEARKYARAALA
ncbi:MAG TPA: hypothetical protein VJ739_13035, partial [Gemmataceae bacterium]|nr:hypothetical protein [Gemmataceae bacterium]